MKTIRINIPPTFKSITSLFIAACAFGFTTYLTCIGKEFQATHSLRQAETFPTPLPEQERDRREILEREAEDQWVKQYGLDQANGGFWAPKKEALRAPEEQKKIDDLVHAVDQYWASQYK